MQDEPKRIAAQRRQLLRQSASERVEAILASRSPRRAVRTLSPQELFLTLREAGLESASPLLAHASRHQLDFLIDLDAWTAGSFDAEALGHWVERLAAAGEDAVARWLAEADEATVVLGLSRLLSVYKADPSVDEDTLPAGRELASLDGIYYLEPAEPCTPEAFLALWRGLQRLRAVDRAAYEGLLEQVIWVIPAEQEETAYEARASRLAEKGFPPLEEALEVWAAGAEELAAVRAEAARLAAPTDSASPPESRAGSPGGAPAALPVSVGTDAFERVSLAVGQLDDEQRDRWLQDLMRLANRFAVAGLEPLAQLETHRRGLRQALSHVQLGLELVAGGDARVERLAEIAVRTSVFALARAGTAAVNARAHRARALLAGWLARVPHAQERLDSRHASVLEALAGGRPAYGLADPARPFVRVSDLLDVDSVLDALTGLGAFLCDHLGADREQGLPELRAPLAAHPEPENAPWHAVALTALARGAAGAPARPEPFTVEELTDAIATLRRLFADRRGVAQALAPLGLEAAAEWLCEVHDEDLALLDLSRPPEPRFVESLLVRG